MSPPAPAQPVAGQPPRVIGGVVVHEVVAGDTLLAIAARYGVDVATLAAQNGRSPGAPLRTGTRLTIDNRHVVATSPGAVIVVNVAQRQLFWQQADGTVIGYPVAVGRASWKTPLGPFTIVQKRIDPVWHVPPSIQQEMRAAGRTPVIEVQPGPDNPLGDRWLGLSLSGIGIHGTNAPSSIFQYTTHGCIRVAPENIRTLFDGVEVGTPGAVIYEPILAAVAGDRVFVEVHRDPYALVSDGRERLRQLLDALGTQGLVDPQRMEDALARRAGIAADVTREAP
jgi:L,D-transpeptidase ErfK/SrfK